MFVQRLKELRARNSLSQKDLARILSVSPGTIGMWETHKRTPDKEMLVRIADYLHVSLDYLVGRPSPSNPIDGLTEENREKALEYVSLLLNQQKLPEDEQADSSGLTNTDKKGEKIRLKRENPNKTDKKRKTVG